MPIAHVRSCVDERLRSDACTLTRRRRRYVHREEGCHTVKVIAAETGMAVLAVVGTAFETIAAISFIIVPHPISLVCRRMLDDDNGKWRFRLIDGRRSGLPVMRAIGRTE